MAKDTTIHRTSEIPLGRLLGALLRDIAHAQHLSNQYTAQVLAQQYNADPLLQCLPMPNGAIQELEVAFEVGVMGIKETPPTADMSRTDALDAVTNVARTFAKSIIEDFLAWIGDLVPKEGHSGEVISTLRKEVANQEQLDSLRVLLIRRVGDFVRERIAQEGHPLNVDTFKEDAAAWIVDILSENEHAREIIKHTRNYTVGVKPDVESLDKRIAKRIDEAVEALARETKRRGRRHGLSLLVSTELSGSPEQIRGTFKIKTKMREYKWVASYEGDAELRDELTGTLVPVE
ncbi:MAG TPA: hypothetical protein PK156_05845 [Polyangium sp.]|nr:hypothetical protein [Polyangium sp.]